MWLWRWRWRPSLGPEPTLSHTRPDRQLIQHTCHQLFYFTEIIWQSFQNALNICNLGPEDAHLLALSESDLPRCPRGISWERVAASLPTVDGRRKGADVKTRYHTLKARKPPATPMSL